MPERQSPWIYDLRVKGMSAVKQSAVLAALREVGIPARRAFRPLDTLPEFDKCVSVGRHQGCETVADVLFREVVALPLLPVDSERAEVAFRIIRQGVK